MLTWFPDRTWNGRTYVPATARTIDEPRGVRLRLLRARRRGRRASPTTSPPAPTSPTRPPRATRTGSSTLCDEVIGTAGAARAAARGRMTLVWGVPLVRGGTVATAELADLSVDQCPLDRGPLHAARPRRLPPSDYLEIKLFNVRGEELRQGVALRRRRRGRRGRGVAVAVAVLAAVDADPVDQAVVGAPGRR